MSTPTPTPTPTVDAGPDQTADEGEEVSFSATITDGLNTYTIEWDFGDGATASGTLTPTHTYADNDVYTVTLTVTVNGGAVGSDTLATTWGEGSSVGLGRVQPPITMMAATMVKVNTIAVDAPLLMACLLFKSTKPELGFVSSNESLAVRSQGIVSLSPLTHPSNFCT